MFYLGFIKIAGEVIKMRATPAKHGGKNGRKIYTLSKDGKKWSCTCPDFAYRRADRGEECKHIKAHLAGKKAWEMKKTAEFDHNNQGNEFKTVNTDPLPNVGPGGMAPSGIASYQPIKSGDSISRSPKKMQPIAIAQFLMGKSAQALGGARKSDTASTVSTQLKFDTSSNDNPEEDEAISTERKERLKKYKRAAKS